MPVHPLVAYDRKRQTVGEVLVFVLVENLSGKCVEVDRDTVVGLQCGDLEVVASDVGAPHFCHIRVSKGCEGTEAEEVAGLLEGLFARDSFFIGTPFEIAQGNCSAPAGNREVI